MKTLIKTIVITMSFIISASLFAAGGHGAHGVKIELGEKKTDNWTLQATQFGNMTTDSTQLVFTAILSASGDMPLGQVETMRIWMGDQDSDALVMKLDGFSREGKLYFHSHLPLENGDDYSQFTVEIDTGNDDGDLLTFKTK